jgi:photosystem II stability/assembly factor-like uncharacterized protein
MSSWKSQGSINRISQYSSFTTNNIVTDTFVLKSKYKGLWDIDGELNVGGDSVINGDVTIKQNATIVGNVDISGSMKVMDTNIIGNLIVTEDAYVRKNIYMDLSGGTVLHGENRRFGFNTVSPQSTIDISGDLERTIDIHSSLVSNKNVVARNNSDHGFTMNIDEDGAYIDFYVDNSMNSQENYNARLLCEPGGKFTIDVTNTMQFKPKIIFSKVSSDDIIADERIVIYDNSNTTIQYSKDVYDASYLKTGTAMYLVAGDNSSNVFFRTSTKEGRGLTLGGGFFPENRINGTVALIDASNIKHPALNIVSSKTANGSIIPRNLRASIGVNKHDVYQTPGGDNRYAMDINGPVRVGHQEVIVVADVAFQVIEMSFYGLVGIAIGTPTLVYETITQYFLKTTDGGYTWSANRIIDNNGQPFSGLEIGATGVILRSVRLDSTVDYLIGGDGGFLFYSNIDTPNVWKQISVTDEAVNTVNIESLYSHHDIVILGFTTSGIGYIVHQNITYIDSNHNHDTDHNHIIDISNNLGDTFAITLPTNPTNPSIDTSLNSVNAIWGNLYRIFIVGNNGLRSANIVGSDPVFDPIVESAMPLYNVHGYVSYISNTSYNHVIAVGNNIIRYSHNDGFTWSSVAISGVLRSVAVVNESCAIAVGDAGLVMYSIDGYASWTIVSAETLNIMGNGGIIAGVNFTNISATSIDKFVISGTISTYSTEIPLIPGRTKMYHLYAPYFLNRPNHHVLEASGNMVVSGDIWIREEGSLRTNNRAFYLLPENTNDIYVGTTGYGNTNVRNRFTVAGTSEVVDLSAQNVDLSGVLRVKTIDTLNSDRIDIGASTSLVNVGSANGEIHILGNLFLPGSITSTTVNNVEIKNKTILLNDESPNINNSAFTGLYIRDNLNDSAGYFVTNGTRTGYVFKTAASLNRVNLDISGLTLSGHMATAERGLLTLKPNFVSDISADYTISTDTIYITDISMLDVSLNRRVWKNVDLTSDTTQVLDTKLASALGLYAGKLEADFITDSVLDISGSAFATRLGLGTTGVNMGYQLDISGSEYVSKNVDISGNMSVQQNIFNYGTIYQW